jgi:sterol desaturase/sphingolipid hydroxylase (fatty acid hydroxylase superfamily)
MMKTLFQWSVWPLCLTANTAPVIAAAMYAPQALPQVAAATTVLLIFVLLMIEQLLPYRADWSARGDSELWRDIGHTVVYAALAVNAAHLLFLVVLAGVLSSLGLADLLGLWPKESPVWLQIVLVIVLGDALEYGYHRLSHTYPALWRVHAIHHTPVRLHTLKGGRHHFLYAFGRGVVVWLPLLVLGAPAELVYWQFVAETITGLVGHANIEFRIPRLMHRLAVTPEFHRLHHSLDPRLGNSNFGVVLPFWDMAFGTHADPLQVAGAGAGIPDDPIPRRFVAELTSPVTYGRLVACRQQATWSESSS